MAITASRAPLSSVGLNHAPASALELRKPAAAAAAHPRGIATFSKATAEAVDAQFNCNNQDAMFAPAQHKNAGPAPLAPSDLYTNDRRRQAAAAAPAPAPAPAPHQQAPSPTKKKSSSSRKPQLPSPPRVIYDSENRPYQRGQLLGQGGFARVYEAIDPEGRAKAFKVIAKSAIMQSKKNRQKILAEIMIHRSLDHIHVVKFEDTFEDTENVYFKLELCSNGSLNDIVKKRGSYTEPEARYFMIQILCGCQNMHLNSIIHRDLKLGNIFLDERMNVKIGDFGLAALLKYPEERKKTVCGTPNYIAPEVLYDQGEGHSFEVDVWSVGVILYTLLIGKPPFQTNNVSEIYEKIKKNDYEIPAKARVSAEAQDLITRILTHNPAERPTLVQIMNHPWFTSGPIPLHIPAIATKGEPFLPALTQQESLHNFAVLKRQANWNPDADKEVEGGDGEEAIEVLADDNGPVRKSIRDELREQEEAEGSREKMDREFQKAIQPGSPISALLKAGRQPLVKAPPLQASTRSSATTSLAKQLSNLALNRQQPLPVDKENAAPSSAMAPPVARLRSGGGGGGYGAGAGASANAAPAGAADEMLHQKARLVAGMSSAAGSVVSSTNNTGTHQAPTESEMVRSSSKRSSVASTASASASASTRKPQSSLECMVSNLSEALQAFSAGEMYTAPSGSSANAVEVEMENVADELNGTRAKPVAPRVFLTSWIDHSERYGLGYALSDGTVGVHFRDSTSMILSATKGTLDYICTLRARPGSVGVGALTTTKLMDQLRRDNYTMPELPAREAGPDGAAAVNAALGASGIPKELHAKVKVMKYFESEIMERLYGADGPLTFVDAATATGMTFLHKWYRCRDAIVFRLSNSTVQFNFYDHTKLLLTSRGQVVSVIEPVEETGGVQTIKSWTLPEFVSIAHDSRSAREAAGHAPRTRPLERKLVRRLVKKLRYARDILANTTTASSSSTKQQQPPPPSRPL